VLLVGRHPECDIRIEVPQVSRRHCCVAQAYDRLTIRDLGSRHGVRVNGRLVSETQLRPGDEVAIAQLIYRIEDDVAPVAVTRPAAPVGDPHPSKPPSLPDLTPEDDGLHDIGLVPLDAD
jgi:hypothetical protein